MKEWKFHALLLFTIFLLGGVVYSTSPYHIRLERLHLGKVVRTSDNIDYDAPTKVGFQDVWVKVNGKIYRFGNLLRGNWLLDEYFSKGETVLVALRGNEIEYVVSKKVLVVGLYALLFALTIIAVAGKKGFRVVLALVYTFTIIFLILYPLILRGWNPALLSLVTLFAISALTMGTVAGFNEKGLAATLGSFLGILSAGLLGLIGLELSGLNPGGFTEFSEMLFFSGHFLDMKALFIGTLIMSSSGAIMDVSIDIASGLYEVHKKAKITGEELFKSGMNIGRDIIGTMANTLILVYAGEMTAGILFFMAKNAPLAVILDYNFIAAEALLALSGSIALALTIPFTAFVCSKLYGVSLKGDKTLITFGN